MRKWREGRERATCPIKHPHAHFSTLTPTHSHTLPHTFAHTFALQDLNGLHTLTYKQTQGISFQVKMMALMAD